MKIIDELKTKGLQSVIDDYSLNAVYSPNKDTVSLTYNQIDSPRFSISDNARGIVLDVNTFEIIARTPKRFYNYGEGTTDVKKFDTRNFKVFEKVDGSLVKVFWYPHEKRWIAASKATASENHNVINPLTGETFNDVVLKAFNYLDCKDVNEFARKYRLEQGNTYMFELTSPHNRIVVDYGEKEQLHYLLTINNETGEHDVNLKVFEGLKKASEIPFTDFENLVKQANMLNENGEGWVIYYNNVPTMKIKGKTYVLLHKMASNSFSPKDIIHVSLENELHELAATFPYYKDMLLRFQDNTRLFKETLQQVYNHFFSLETKKDVGLASSKHWKDTVDNSLEPFKDDITKIMTASKKSKADNLLTRLAANMVFKDVSSVDTFLREYVKSKAGAERLANTISEM